MKNRTSKKYKPILKVTQESVITNAIKNKYKIDSIKFNCINCAKIVFEQDNGYITDEELLNHPVIKKYFKPK
jgi:hypothetical protein